MSELLASLCAVAAEKQGLIVPIASSSSSGFNLFPIVPIAILVVVSLICALVSMKQAEKKGYSKLGFFLLGLVLDIIGLIISLCVPPRNTQPYDNVDLLIKYKSLLDDGAITQEEFDRKKHELL